MAMEEQRALQCASEHHHHLYRLVALQIRDIQSYVSRLFLFMACRRSSLVFLVDNGPWSAKESRSRPAELWQLMVTKSRVSPFANHRLRRRTLVPEEEDKVKSTKETEKTNIAEALNAGLEDLHLLYNWDSIFSTIQRRCRTLIHSKAFCPQFHGCVAFEVSWDDIRGMNYLNELQTDTCLSLEVKVLRKREFDSIRQALDFYGSECLCETDQSNGKPERCVSDTYMGTCKRQCFLDDDGTDTYTYNGFFTVVKERTGFLEAGYCSPSLPDKSPMICSRSLSSTPDKVPQYRQEVPVAHIYKDTLLVFRFSDPLLPFELRDIITSDQRLLKMLESGLPPWVIFLQSYPLFCQLYRPWMRPLARTIYFIVSVVTVMIGFYDLYKNIPVLKAHMFGPLFEWVESWEMVSRLKYLGTMLVLQNYEKAFVWVLVTIKAFRQLVSLLMRPVIEPLMFLWIFFLPFWLRVVSGAQSLAVAFGGFFTSVLVAVRYVLNLVIWPFWMFFTTLWNLVLCPLFSAIGMILSLPVSAGQYIVEFWSLFYSELLGLFKLAWLAVNQSVQLGAVASSSLQTPQGPSAWRLLWDEIFSKVFRGVRYVLNGLVAFFQALNRHRLSIYNNMVAFLVRLTCALDSGRCMLTNTWHHLYPKPSTKSNSIRTGNQVKED